MHHYLGTGLQVFSLRYAPSTDIEPISWVRSTGDGDDRLVDGPHLGANWLWKVSFIIR